MFRSISQIKDANKRIGHHWFQPEAMRFFRSRIESGVYGGRYFISSEQFDDNSPRLYTVHEASPEGKIDTIGEFQQYAHLEDARDAVKSLVRLKATRHSRSR
jgi:hypothetical protein